MSRNLSETDCHFCNGEVKLDEKPREVTREDVGLYYDTHEGYGHAGMIAAKASCVDCNAKYLAWVDLSKCAGYSLHYSNLLEGREFFDLSFRSSFNDEPGIEDMPDEVIERKMVISKRKPWPLCSDGCGSKALTLNGFSAHYCPVCRRAQESRINKPNMSCND